MKTKIKPQKLANDNNNLLAYISWQEQLAVGLIFATIALIFVPTFWRGLACGHDTIIHFYRVVQMAINVQDGAPFTQLGQHFMRGYGYTIYPYYAPLMYWLTTIIHFLGFDFSLAVRLLVWISLLVAGWGGYNLGRRYFNPGGAFVAGLAYMFAPYLIYNATQRGAFPELLALALLPWALAATDLAIFRRTPRSIGMAVFTFSLVMLSHNIIPNFGFIILLGLALSRSQKLNLRSVWQALWPTLTVIGLTLIITSFFWLPAYVELDFVQSRRENSPFSFWPRFEQHFIRTDELVGFPEEPADSGLSNPPTSIRIGAGQALLAVIGVAMSLLLKGYRRRWFWMWALITAVSLLLATRLTLPIWEILPLPEFVQLPTRFFGPASLGVAVLAGIGGDWFGQRIGQFAWPKAFKFNQIFIIGLYILGAVFVAMSGWFWLFPVICKMPVRPTAATVAQSTFWQDENTVLYWGGDSAGETLARWVDVLPDPDVFMPSYEAGENINRLVLPENAILLDWETSADGDWYRLQIPEAQTLTYRSFYTPYWRAKVNGESVLISPKPVDGLILVDVPSGDVELSIKFGPTPLRIITLIVSGITFIILCIWAWRNPSQTNPYLPKPSRIEWGTFMGVVVLLAFGFVYVNYTNNAIRSDRFTNNNLKGVDNPVNISFDGEFTYLGYSGADHVAADESFYMTQYWAPENEIGVPYRFRLRIADEIGNVWHLPFGRPYSYTYLPGKAGWQVGKYVRDAYEFNMLPGTPPGDYWLEASVFRSDTDLSLMPRQEVETAVNPAWVRVGKLEVMPGDWKLTSETAHVDTYKPTPITAVPGLTLAGWTVPDVFWRPGDLAELDLLWQFNEGVPESVVANLQLLDERGELMAETAVVIGNDNSLPVIRNQVQWRLPASLESGKHSVLLSLGKQIIELGTWQIDAPPRSFEIPEVDIMSDFAVDFAELVGYSLSSKSVTPGDSVELELVWQVMVETPTSYRVFVHVLDENGTLITQSDAIPDNWTRPTTGWSSGEYIRDKHTLSLPANATSGDYSLTIGFYETITGNRVGEAEIGILLVSDD